MQKSHLELIKKVADVKGNDFLSRFPLTCPSTCADAPVLIEKILTGSTILARLE